MRCRTNVIVLGIDLSYYYNLILGMMTEIFKSLIGMTFMIGLFLILETLIQFHAPELDLIASTARGFVYIIFLMGIVIISKSSIDLLRTSNFKK